MNDHIKQGLPRQRLSFKQKTKAWRKENIDHAERFSLYNNLTVRNTLQDRVRNTLLYNGVVSYADAKIAINPNNIDANYVPHKIPHHPIMAPKLDVLIGEEINRKFDFSFTTTSPDAITSKQDDKKQQIMQMMSAAMEKDTGGDPKAMEAEMAGIQKFLKYDYKDIRERMVNQLMTHYYEVEEFDAKFNEGFKEVLLNGEEIYSCDIIGDEPKLERLNGLKVRTIRSGGSNRIEDSDIIIIEDHWSPGRIIDTFYDVLKPKDIDYVTGYTSSAKSSESYTDDHNNPLLFDNGTGDIESIFESYQTIATVNGHMFGNNFTNADGDLRVIKMLWRSQKAIYQVQYFDELGDTQLRIESEEYIADKDKGETIKKLWVNEWWEATKIGHDLYVQMRPRPIQYVNMSNPSKCYPGIVGQVYNTNQGKAVSLVDKMKSYQYLYDAIWNRLNKAIAKNLGKILLLDIAVVPNGWEPEKWMAQATNMGIGLVDGFKEGNKGSAQGKLAGNLNGATNTRSIDLETGNYIQQHVNLLEFIKAEMGEIAGISPQREGQVSNRESVGGVERAVTQSSHITEWWFSKHDQVKKRVISTFLETAKFALQGKNKKVNYIADDLTKQVLNIDGDVINESDYDIIVTNSRKTSQVKQVTEQLAQAFMQNGGRYSTVLDIFNSDSLADMRNKIEQSEDEQSQREAEASQAQAEQAKAALEAQEAAARRDDNNKKADRLLKKYEIDSNNMVKREALDSNELGNDQTIEQAKLDQTATEHSDDLLVKLRALDNDMTKSREDNKMKKYVADKKPAPTSNTKK
jgi:hypothetical protein